MVNNKAYWTWRLKDAADKSFDEFNNVANISLVSEAPNPFQKNHLSQKFQLTKNN